MVTVGPLIVITDGGRSSIVLVVLVVLVALVLLDVLAVVQKMLVMVSDDATWRSLVVVVIQTTEQYLKSSKSSEDFRIDKDQAGYSSNDRNLYCLPVQVEKPEKIRVDYVCLYLPHSQAGSKDLNSWLSYGSVSLLPEQ